MGTKEEGHPAWDGLGSQGCVPREGFLAEMSLDLSLEIHGTR